MPVTIELIAPSHLEPGQLGELLAEAGGLDADVDYHFELHVKTSGAETVYKSAEARPHEGRLRHTFALKPEAPGPLSVRAELWSGSRSLQSTVTQKLTVIPLSQGRRVDGGAGAPAPGGPSIFNSGGITKVALQRTAVPQTDDEALWMAIRSSCAALSFTSYSAFLNRMLEPPGDEADAPTVAGCGGADRAQLRHFVRRRALPFPGVDAYRWLKVATEVFVVATCGVPPRLVDADKEELLARMGLPFDGDPNQVFTHYRAPQPGEDPFPMLPYMRIVFAKLAGESIFDGGLCGPEGELQASSAVLAEKLNYPCMLELIWSYWHEEGMLVQTMNAISQRFQNRHAQAVRDPLAQLEIDPLRPLNNLLWGYIQDEQHRLSVLRRAHEYEHQYGFTLHGRALRGLRAADSRSKFLESFHNLLYKCTQFYRQDDDATVIADGFPVLNALKETHYLLAEGAHNQFGDLPATSRQEMLMQQWLLARPEMREFLGGRVMVPHPEAWMDRVDAMKTLQGWTDTGVVHFRDLGVFGEQVLLSIRYGGWSAVNNRDQAANWARYWRTEVQGYIHGYRAVTGVDLAVDPSSVRNAEERYLPPSVHLRHRLASQRRR